MKETPNDARQMTEYLTKRQKLVLSLIAHGFSNAEIATLTDKSLRTVEGIRKSIIQKLKTTNTPEAICKAMAQGILIYEPNKYMEVKLLLYK